MNIPLPSLYPPSSHANLPLFYRRYTTNIGVILLNKYLLSYYGFE